MVDLENSIKSLKSDVKVVRKRLNDTRTDVDVLKKANDNDIT